jgi:hypothetical protein
MLYEPIKNRLAPFDVLKLQADAKSISDCSGWPAYFLDRSAAAISGIPNTGLVLVLGLS